MSEYESRLAPGQIRFHQWCEPPLESGHYTVNATQAVTELGAVGEKAFKNEFSFWVAGPRFSLDPSDVYCVYPPKEQSGDFASSLPHIVLTRRTLPWERSVHPGPRKAGDRLPWMALLVLSAADFPRSGFPDLELRKLENFINPKPEAPFLGPRLDLAPYEKPGDLCNTIELPWTVFRGVAPSADDLAFLAHVREVKTDDKETLSFLADGWFSVVVANRFPEPERREKVPTREVENRAYLVSLEGMTDYLPGSGKAAAEKPVRLAVLSSWRFHCRAASGFKASMGRLEVGLLGMPKVRGAAGTEAEKQAEGQVDVAWALGYTALNHSTRLGERAVSWYRGPLVPLDLAKVSKFDFRPAADAALRYSPLDGMMDVSYAAAYQLGRLLALQDRHFATALHAYRNGVQRQINEVLGRKRAESVLEGATGDRETEVMSSYLARLDPAARGSAGARDWAVKERFGLQREEGARKPGELSLTTDFDLTIPESVCRWLARLVLLYRVPFAYLVADERMLPVDSIRFFYLDPNWLKCLLEGACSVGRSSTRDELVDQHLRDRFLDFAMERSLEVRTRAPEAHAAKSDAISVKATPKKRPRWPLTGFLLRSAAVEGWQGLEMQAWEDGRAATALVPLRIDRLAPDIMLCIFDGRVARIEVKQPPEGMHFGATVDGKGFKKAHLRRFNDNSLHDAPDDVPPGPGHQLDESSATSVRLRADADRVVDVAALASDLSRKLVEMRAQDPGKEFTSAEFGVEMVESPGRVVFDVNAKRDPAR